MAACRRRQMCSGSSWPCGSQCQTAWSQRAQSARPAARARRPGRVPPRASMIAHAWPPLGDVRQVEQRRCRASGSGAADRHRRAELVDEAAARLVVAAVRPEEVLVPARQLLAAVGAQRLDLLVARALAALLLEPAARARRGGRAARRGRGAGRRSWRRSRRTPRRSGRSRPRGACRPRWNVSVSSRGELVADAARHQVGPVLGPVEAAHVLVVRVEDDVLAGHDVVGGHRERHAAGRRVALEGGDDEVRVGLDDLAHDVVDRVQVVPGLLARVLGRLDDVEVDAVGEEVGCRRSSTITLVLAAAARVAVGLEQPPALSPCSSRRCRSRTGGSRRRPPRCRRSRARCRPSGIGAWSGAVDLRHVQRHAGELERAGSGQLEDCVASSRRFRWVIQTAPSTVARQMRRGGWR